VTNPIEARRQLAKNLLFRIEEYMRTHEIPARFLGLEACGNESFIYDLRKGSVPLLKSIQKMTDFLDDNPNGIEYLPPKRRGQPNKLNQFVGDARCKIEASTLIVFRDPCFLFGVRGDIGCRHHPKSQPVPLREMVGCQ
jgi:hypothetical protein